MLIQFAPAALSVELTVFDRELKQSAVEPSVPLIESR
jgi:hypothetical protein